MRCSVASLALGRTRALRWKALTVVSFVSFVCVSALASQEEDMGQFDTVEPLEESTTSLVSSSTSAYSSFPVDVVVYVRVQVLGLAPARCAATSVFNIPPHVSVG